MDISTKILCKNQLENLGKSFVENDGKALSLLIIKTCSSLMNVVEMNTPAASLSVEDLTELIRGYNVMRHIMSTFINDAAKLIDTEELKKEIDGLVDDYKKYEEEYLVAEKKRDDIVKSIEQKQSEINDIYALNGGLFKSYENAVDKLEKLKKLEGEFSEEALTIAEQECVKLTEETTALQERQNVVNAQTAECLGQISGILAKLEGKVSAENENVKTVCKQADDLKKAVTALTAVYDEYKSWFNVLKTPAQQMEEDIGKPEMEKLRDCLNESTLKRKHEVVKQTEENLKYLEKLVASCAVEAQSDNINIERRTGK